MALENLLQPVEDDVDLVGAQHRRRVALLQRLLVAVNDALEGADVGVLRVDDGADDVAALELLLGQLGRRLGQCDGRALLLGDLNVDNVGGLVLAHRRRGVVLLARAEPPGEAARGEGALAAVATSAAVVSAISTPSAAAALLFVVEAIQTERVGVQGAQRGERLQVNLLVDVVVVNQSRRGRLTARRVAAVLTEVVVAMVAGGAGSRGV